MANHKSAIKKARMSLRRNAINTRTMTEVRTLEKKVIKLVGEKKKEDSAKALVEYMSKMAKAAQKGRIKAETASRKISRLSTRVSTM